MKNIKFYITILVTLLIAVFLLRGYIQIKAQENVISFLESQLIEKNVPIVKIESLEIYPIRLQVVVQGESEFVTDADKENLHLIDREIIISAKEQGYYIDSYTKILIDPEGKEIYKVDKYIDDANIQSEISTFEAINSYLPEEEVEALIKVRINELISKYNIAQLNIASDVSPINDSNNDFRTLNINAIVNNLDEGYSVAGLIFPLEGTTIPELNKQGAQIVMFKFEIYNSTNDFLFRYFFDFQLQSGRWSHSDIFPIELFGSQPASAPPFPPTDVPPIYTAEATAMPSETITPTP